MIPLRDATPTRRRPIVTVAVGAVCMIGFALELAVEARVGAEGVEELLTSFGVVPAVIWRDLGRGEFAGPAGLSLLAAMFLHAGWLHLVGNLLYLWIFGAALEDRLGHARFGVLYLLGGLAASLAQAAASPSSTVPIVGASGAIAAILGAYLVLFPRARILSLVFLGFFYQLVQVPALILLGFWFALQLVNALGVLGPTPSGGGVAVVAHVGGFVVGAVAGAAARARGTALRWGVG